jgi:hypothetical protein
MEAHDSMDIWSRKAPAEPKRQPASRVDMGMMFSPAPRASRGLDMLDVDPWDAPDGRFPLDVDLGNARALQRGRETPPLSMQFQEVLLRGPGVEQHKRAMVNQSAPSSFETNVCYPTDYQDDDDDDDLDECEYLEGPITDYRRPGTIESRIDELIMDKMDDIYQTYLAGGGSQQRASGVTIMLRDIPYRMQVEPDLFRILRQTADLNHVDYIYLPMTIEGVSTRSNVQPRNKGYCFIHFSVEATAHAFATRVQEYVIPDTFGGKTMFASRAKFQGLSMNLVNLLDIQSKKWRPKHGVAHIRASTGELVCVGLLPLRNLFKKRSMRSGWQGAKAGPLRALPAGRPGQRP